MKLKITVSGDPTFPVEDYEIIANITLSLMSFGIKANEIAIEKEAE